MLNISKNPLWKCRYKNGSEYINIEKLGNHFFSRSKPFDKLNCANQRFSSLASYARHLKYMLTAGHDLTTRSKFLSVISHWFAEALWIPPKGLCKWSKKKRERGIPAVWNSSNNFQTDSWVSPLQQMQQILLLHLEEVHDYIFVCYFCMLLKIDYFIRRADTVVLFKTVGAARTNMY